MSTCAQRVGPSAAIVELAGRDLDKRTYMQVVRAGLQGCRPFGTTPRRSGRRVAEHPQALAHLAPRHARAHAHAAPPSKAPDAAELLGGLATHARTHTRAQ